jgi:tight adherence protein B
MIFLTAILAFAALAGIGFVLTADNSPRKRVQAIARPEAGRAQKGPVEGPQKRRNVANVLKDMEKKRASSRKEEKPTIRQRLDQAGLTGISTKLFWAFSALFGAVVAALLFFSKQPLLAVALAAFGAAFGVPRWILGFLIGRRRKKFTAEFANAIDVIVRSVRSGLPTNEALRIIARESPDPVGAEFTRLVEGLKMGVTLEQGLKRMHESMPTAEVAFFAIVMTIQAKAGGNLSEALGNLSAVLRDRKRLQGKIRAMSSEAKASAGIIGSLPPVVMGLVWITTPAYIGLLFSERLGNLMLVGCAVWMSIGIMVMRKMINFKH